MKTPDNETEDGLTRDYRRSSNAEAGAPSAATRAAILAEARAAALRRTPAANDSRYVWRAAAGIAMLGVAVILWRQAAPKLAPDLTVTTSERSAAAQEPAAASPLDAPAVNPVAAAKRTEMAERRAADQAPPEPATKDEPELQSKAAPARPREEGAGSNAAISEAAGNAVLLARAGAQAVAPTPAAASTAAAAPMQAAGALRKDSTNYQQLLQREFPEVWNGSEPPHTVWVVMDANGKVLRKGGLSPGATISADQPFESTRPWQMIDVNTASGSSLQLAVMSAN